MFVTNFVNHLSSYFEEIVEKDGLCGGCDDFAEYLDSLGTLGLLQSMVKKYKRS